MRKIILGVVAAAAIATPLVAATAANAAVSYEPTHDGIITGHVDKSDVQNLLGWNEDKVQNTPVNFSSTFTVTQDQSFSCNDGTVDHGVQTITQDVAINAAAVREGTKQKIKAWDLTGMGATSNMVVTKTGPFNGFGTACTGHGGWYGFSVAQDHALGETLLVNGVALPETTVAIPVV